MPLFFHSRKGDHSVISSFLLPPPPLFFQLLSFLAVLLILLTSPQLGISHGGGQNSNATFQNLFSITVSYHLGCWKWRLIVNKECDIADILGMMCASSSLFCPDEWRACFCILI